MTSLWQRGVWAVIYLSSSTYVSAASLLPDSPFSRNAAGTTAASFLNVPSSARAQALGGAYVTVVDNAEAMFWNPAGLASIKPGQSEISLSYDTLLSGAYAGSAAFARSLGKKSALGAGFTYYSAGSIQGYNTLGDPTSSFSPNDMAVSVAYARKMRHVLTLENLEVGAALKLIRSSISDISGVGVAADLGAQMKHVTDVGDDSPLDAGVSLQHIGPPLRMGSASDPLPMRAQGGFLWHITPQSRGMLEGHFPVHDSPYLSVGLEGDIPLNRVIRSALRAGYNMENARKIEGTLRGLTVGFGLDMQRFRLDYAWVPLGDIGYTNRISLGFIF